MSVIGVIPARGGSQRVPGKNIMPIVGKPVIGYTIESALQARTLDRVIVSTDHPDIAETAKKLGAEVVQRPKELATNEAAIDDALRHVVTHLKEVERYSAEIVVLMQANNPVRKLGEIDEVVESLRKSPSATAVATAYKVSQRPEWAKLIVDKRTMEIGPFMDAGTHYRKQDLPELYLLDGSVYAIWTDVLMKTSGDRRVHAYLGEHVRVIIHESKYAVEIDELEDVEQAEFYLSQHQ